MIKIVTLEKSFGSLREIDLGSNEAWRIAKLEDYKLTASIKTLRCWSDYGQFNENRISISIEGKDDDIKINDSVFSANVKDVLKFYLSRDDVHHDFAISGQTLDGKIFEQTFYSNEDGVLPFIIYAMLLVAYAKEAKLAYTYWDMLMAGKFPPTTVGRKIDLANEVKEMLKVLTKEYPFMKKFAQEGMERVAASLKSDLDSLKLLYQ